ncbi:thrS: threonine--tRNA ligase [Rubrobacter radiotolerans]|uniref:Threonine--tRNA ligase n=1 Tax=Rubrobacter radiotolerans TaxID=42256 RepID=A0A023X2M4_RUBRA|nr:threonine--tRNA ligase [Rubrobacter radiotolerans]AHY46558.1 thrS: threonine--tRNA ligase [Rubrobacter radiotolerans]MDX5893966.1 threonine--tRNA ligase [Rubrobacter radiotolerans]SMC04866.1 threonyl-tRNA synthetase [Rubrobacter radiotolerans DSM 5868]
MAAVRLPDGREMEVAPGERARDVVARIGPRLLKDAVVAKLDGRLIDLDAPVDSGGEFAVVTKDTDEGLEVIRHSTAHAMAQAVLELYPGSKLTIGPPIEDGFFYDIDVAGRITDEDLPRIEEKMREVAERDLPIEREHMSKDEVTDLYRENEYKLELIEGLEDGEITVYRQGEFFDLCRGPHVPSTGRIGAFRLQNIAGAYWRGDEKNPMLTRIYGTAWATEKQLKAYLKRLEEARERDHRKVGRDLELFTFSPDVGAGIPLFFPKGEQLRHQMESYVREVQTRYGYDHVWSGNLANQKLYEKSGHLEHYIDDMFPAMEDGETKYRLKPMNCPSHMTIFNARAHSYRDLPVRYAEFATLYRYEKSGQLNGLTRVRALTQDDAHVFCTPDQIQSEFARALDIIREVLDTYGFTDYRVQLSLRDTGSDAGKYIADDEKWARAERELTEALDAAKIPYEPEYGEAAFYGPKADFMAKDVLGREWQLSTVQVDFLQPGRLGCEYVDENGDRKTPVLLHRAVTGTTERFMGVLIEHYNGAFPTWLAPVQAVVIPIADRHNGYAGKVRDRLAAAGIRAEVDDSLNSMQKKIRENARQKVPYLLVVGDREAETGSVNVRRRGEGKKQTAMGLEEFAEEISGEVASRSKELTVGASGS